MFYAGVVRVGRWTTTRPPASFDSQIYIHTAHQQTTTCFKIDFFQTFFDFFFTEFQNEGGRKPRQPPRRRPPRRRPPRRRTGLILLYRMTSDNRCHDIYK
jgi:hypothetical protein